MTVPTNLILISLAIAGLSAVPMAVAQQRGGGGPSARNCNTNTVETVRGEVVSVEKTTPPQGRGAGVHLVLKTDKETVPVRPTGLGWGTRTSRTAESMTVPCPLLLNVTTTRSSASRAKNLIV